MGRSVGHRHSCRADINIVRTVIQREPDQSTNLDTDSSTVLVLGARYIIAAQMLSSRRAYCSVGPAALLPAACGCCDRKGKLRCSVASLRTENRWVVQRLRGEVNIVLSPSLTLTRSQWRPSAQGAPSHALRSLSRLWRWRCHT